MYEQITRKLDIQVQYVVNGVLDGGSNSRSHYCCTLLPAERLIYEYNICDDYEAKYVYNVSYL